MAVSLLDQAKKYFAQKRYAEVISLLQPHVLEYKESFEFHFYVGLAFMYTGEIENALDYFSAARKIKIADPDLLVAQAALYLRRGDTKKAITYYLDALSHKRDCKLAKKGLETIRTMDTPEAIGEFVQSGKILKLYPNPARKEAQGKKMVAGMLILIVAVVTALIVPYIIKTRNFSGPIRKDISYLDLASSDKKAAVDLQGTYSVVLTNDDVIKTYEKAQKYFQTRHDNLAQGEINKLLYSNASVAVKQKARLLMQLLEAPDFATFKDGYSYKEVSAEPSMYVDCYVIWRGMATNIETGVYNTMFDLLVGYDTKVQMEGLVPVSCQFIANIDSEKPLEVLGKIKIKHNVLCVDAVSIYQSGKPLKTK